MIDTQEQEPQKDLLKEVHEICHGLEMSEDVLDKASELLDEYRDDFKVNGDYFPAAAVHIASRIEEEPRTQKMITEYLKSRDNIFDSTDDRLEEKVREAVKKLKKKDEVHEELELVKSKEYLPYIISQLPIEVKSSVAKRAKAYCDVVETRPGVARSKAAIAGACLKQAMEENGDDRIVTHTQLAKITGMNKKTFENNLNYLRENHVLPRTGSS